MISGKDKMNKLTNRNDPKFKELDTFLSHSVISPPPNTKNNMVTFEDLAEIEDDIEEQKTNVSKLIPQTFLEK
jgi:hypothetical protein